MKDVQSIDIGLKLYDDNSKYLYALSSEGQVTIALIKPNDHPVMSSDSLKIPIDKAGDHLFTVIRCTKKRILVSAHHLHSRSNILFLLDSTTARKISSPYLTPLKSETVRSVKRSKWAMP